MDQLYELRREGIAFSRIWSFIAALPFETTFLETFLEIDWHTGRLYAYYFWVD